ncbi:MAG: CHAP domain-containing protein [Verrucomicrobiae bacterium]|nr:CHAP domain-containing protein [Verrucomicrobiae bacterium]
MAVYDNGEDYVRSWGRHYAWCGYYYGQKWQCVEFVKRFFYQAKGHRMPEVMGHAIDFWDEEVEDGGMNEARGLRQYRNGGAVAPAADDLLVVAWTRYGHVAVISEVNRGAGYVEVVQQNVRGRTRERWAYRVEAGQHWVGEEGEVVGWMRKEDYREGERGDGGWGGGRVVRGGGE